MGLCNLGGKENFLRRIVSNALTALGVTTKIGDSPQTYANNINTLATNKYNDGVNATQKGNAAASDVISGKTFTSASAGVNASGSLGKLTSSNFSGTRSSTTAGAASNYTVKSTSRGYVDNGTTVNTWSASAYGTIAPAGGNGNVDVNLVPGFYNKITVDRTNAYNAGAAAKAISFNMTDLGRGNVDFYNNPTGTFNIRTGNTDSTLYVIGVRSGDSGSALTFSFGGVGNAALIYGQGISTSRVSIYRLTGCGSTITIKQTSGAVSYCDARVVRIS